MKYRSGLRSDPVPNLTQKSSKQTFWAWNMMITSKMWPLEPFPLIWSGDLVFDPQVIQFLKLDLEIIKTNIFQQDSWLLQKYDF